MTKIYDAIIIGAGHNGLTAALYLARGGWKTLVLERNECIGGAIRSAEVTLPGFIHDLYSTNQNLFLGSPVYKELRADLERHGLRYRTASSVYCNVFPDRTGLRVYQHAEQTLQEFQRHDPQGALGWLRLYEHFAQFKQSLLPLYAMPLPSSKAALGILRAIRSVGVPELLELGRIVLSSTRELADAYFVSPEAKALIAAWGMHLDFGPDVSGGGMFPFLEAFADMEVGMSIVEGGASRMVQALAGLLAEYGGEVRTQSPVGRVLLSGDIWHGPSFLLKTWKGRIPIWLEGTALQAAIICGKTFSSVLFPDGRPIACLLSICIWWALQHGPAQGPTPLRATWLRTCYSTRTRYAIVFWQEACSLSAMLDKKRLSSLPIRLILGSIGRLTL